MKGKYKKKRERKERQQGLAAQVQDNDPSSAINQQQPKQTTNSQPTKLDTSMLRKWLTKIRSVSTNEIAILALIVTVIIAAIYFFQLLSMQNSVKIQRQTMVVSQRAYVQAKYANIITGEGNILLKPPAIRPSNAPIMVDVTFADSGQTWARNEGGSINFYLSVDGIPNDFTYPEASLSQPVLVAPQTETHLSKMLNETDFDDIRGQPAKKKFFVYGTLRYQDVFGDWHKTEYCFQLAGVTYKTDGTVDRYVFWEGPAHNCADDDCKD